MTESTFERPWLKSYPPGMPATIPADRPASLVEVLERAVGAFGDRPAYSNMGATLSYRQLDRLTRDFAAFLQQELGMRRGERIALMMPNLLQYPVALFGALRAGLTVVNTNPLYTARELKHQLADSGAGAIVLLENFAHVLEAVLPETQVEHVVLTAVGDCLPFPKSKLANFVVRRVRGQVPGFHLPEARHFGAALKKGRACRLAPVQPGRDDIAFLQYTGGTTGLAKGAVLTHGNMVANLVQAMTWISPVLEEGREIIITALPLYHIFALLANCLLFLHVGGHNVLITNPRDMPGFVKELSRYRFTALTGVNTLFNGLLHTPGFSELDFSAFRMTLGGGMAVQPAVAEQWKQVTGTTLVEAYGLTETSPAVCINPMDLAAYNGSIGLPVPSTDCSIQDDRGNLLAPGETGELCVRGPQVMREYWNQPGETAAVLDADGWLHTGDIASMDEDGYFRIVDRKKDMILVSGFNVYPNEVEAVLASHPGVVEAGAIGVPDEKSGEVVKAIVVRGDPALSEETLEAHCRKDLAAYKVPRYFQFVEALPKTNVGKILRRELRERYGRT